MRKKNYKGRVVKRYLPKCNDICRTYDPIMTAYADILSKKEEVEEFRCNVYLGGLTEGDYTTDFLIKMKDGTFMVRECVYRSRIIMPMHYAYVDIFNNKIILLDSTAVIKYNNTRLKNAEIIIPCWSRAESTTQSRLEMTNFSRSEIANAAADSFLLRF